MPLRLAEHPAHDRPRERFCLLGPAALMAQELLAILLGTGTRGRDALAVAADLLRTSDGSLRRLMARSASELGRIPSMGKAKAARLLAGLELGRRAATEADPVPERVGGAGGGHPFSAPQLPAPPPVELHTLA